MGNSSQRVYIRAIDIQRVRHLSDIRIVLEDGYSEPVMKHLLLTGKNGSGKTSVLDALEKELINLSQDKEYFNYPNYLDINQKNLTRLREANASPDQIDSQEERIESLKKQIEKTNSGVTLSFSHDIKSLRGMFEKGQFILAYFKAARIFDAPTPKHVEKVLLKNQYMIGDDPRKDFIKYLVDKKVSQSLYQTEKDEEKAKALGEWFDSFEKLLRKIFEDDTLTLEFDVNTFSFYILEKGRERFDFGTLADGYAAILDIVVSIIMRMEAVSPRGFLFDLPGIVLIDELETHLHYELQEKILPFLCSVFPNVQFIISTHSAFILNSIDNAVIYDLENRITVNDGLANVPYEGIIEGYFNVSTLSTELQQKFERYKQLIKKEQLTDEDLAEIQRLSVYLDEIPDYLAFNLTTEYRRLKLEFAKREEL